MKRLVACCLCLAFLFFSLPSLSSSAVDEDLEIFKYPDPEEPTAFYDEAGKLAGYYETNPYYEEETLDPEYDSNIYDEMELGTFSLDSVTYNASWGNSGWVLSDNYYSISDIYAFLENAYNSKTDSEGVLLSDTYGSFSSRFDLDDVVVIGFYHASTIFFYASVVGNVGSKDTLFQIYERDDGGYQIRFAGNNRPACFWAQSLTSGEFKTFSSSKGMQEFNYTASSTDGQRFPASGTGTGIGGSDMRTIIFKGHYWYKTYNFQSEVLNIVCNKSGEYFGIYGTTDQATLPPWGLSNYPTPESAAAQAEQDRHEETGGWLSQLGDRIGTFFDNLLAGILDGLKTLFLPDSEWVSEVISSEKAFLSEHLGVLFEAPMIVGTILVKLNNFEPLEDNFVIEFPAVNTPSYDFSTNSIIWYPLIPETTFNITELLESIPPLRHLYNGYLSFIKLVFVFLAIRLFIRKLNEILTERGTYS